MTMSDRPDDQTHSEKDAAWAAEVDDMRGDRAISRETSKDLIYAWQMLNDNGVWNIIGIGTPAGLTLPLVTTQFNVAWEAFTIAQEHADKYSCECRLAVFSFDGVTAIVHPREAE